MTSTLIPLGPGAVDEQPSAPVAPVVKALSVPLDVAKAIQRDAEHHTNRSDPFHARRLAAHYRQGIWVPADAAK
jgi:hypothetical protein